MVIGSALLVRCHGPLSRADWEERRSNHCVAGAALPYGASTYAWELSAAMRFDAPVSYLHKRGCVVSGRRSEMYATEETAGATATGHAQEASGRDAAG